MIIYKKYVSNRAINSNQNSSNSNRNFSIQHETITITDYDHFVITLHVGTLFSLIIVNNVKSVIKYSNIVLFADDLGISGY